MGAEVEGWGVQDESLYKAGRPRSSWCSDLGESFPSGGLLGLSRSSPHQYQPPGRLLLPPAQPRRALGVLCQPGLGAADCSSGCGDRGSPVEEEKVLGRGPENHPSEACVVSIPVMEQWPCFYSPSLICKASSSTLSPHPLDEEGYPKWICFWFGFWFLTSTSFPVNSVLNDQELIGDPWKGDLGCWQSPYLCFP